MCVYMYMYIFVFVCVGGDMYLCICIRMYVWMDGRTCVYVRVCVYPPLHVSLFFLLRLGSICVNCAYFFCFNPAANLVVLPLNVFFGSGYEVSRSLLVRISLHVLLILVHFRKCLDDDDRISDGGYDCSAFGPVFTEGI